MGCVISSIEAYLTYSGSDSGPEIVQLVYEGEFAHWYYRSANRIVTPSFYIDNRKIESYDGPFENLKPELKKYFMNFISAPDIMMAVKRIQKEDCSKNLSDCLKQLMSI